MLHGRVFVMVCARPDRNVLNHCLNRQGPSHAELWLPDAPLDYLGLNRSFLKKSCIYVYG